MVGGQDWTKPIGSSHGRKQWPWQCNKRLDNEYGAADGVSNSVVAGNDCAAIRGTTDVGAGKRLVEQVVLEEEEEGKKKRRKRKGKR